MHRPEIGDRFSVAAQRIIVEPEVAHDTYYRSEIFSGPSLYFHERALAAAAEGSCQRFAESVYGALASWGMHRMGRGGPKMLEFEDFRGSLEPYWPMVMELRRLQPAELDAAAWGTMEKIFRGLRCMATGTSLVAHSKALAHAVPNLVAPIDREYTLRFLFGSTDVKNGMDREWQLFRDIHTGFFHPLLEVPRVWEAITTWTAQPDRFRWDTSPLKVLDNLVIGSVRRDRGTRKKSR